MKSHISRVRNKLEKIRSGLRNCLNTNYGFKSYTLRTDENCLYSKEAFRSQPVEVLDQNSQIDAHVYHRIINDTDDKEGEEAVGTPVGNNNLIECFVKKLEEFLIKAKHLYYWRITTDEGRDAPIYIRPDGTIYVEEYKTEFNICYIKEMKYDFYDDEEATDVPLHFGQNTMLSFSSEYRDNQLYLSINETFSWDVLQH